MAAPPAVRELPWSLSACCQCAPACQCEDSDARTPDLPGSAGARGPGPRAPAGAFTELAWNAGGGCSGPPGAITSSRAGGGAQEAPCPWRFGSRRKFSELRSGGSESGRRGCLLGAPDCRAARAAAPAAPGEGRLGRDRDRDVRLGRALPRPGGSPRALGSSSPPPRFPAPIPIPAASSRSVLRLRLTRGRPVRIRVELGPTIAAALCPSRLFPQGRRLGCGASSSRL